MSTRLHDESARWPFENPPNTAAFTSKDVLDLGMPVLYVTHDQDDGDFQFHSANGAPNDVKDARIVGLGTMLRLDPSIAEVADLPLGWEAHRVAPGMPWQREGPLS